MHLIKDFFLLNWQDEVSHDFQSDVNLFNHILEIFKRDEELFIDSSCIILIANAKNSSQLLTLDSFTQTLQTFCEGLSENILSLQKIQKELLYFLHVQGNLSLNKSIQKRFELLRKESVIGYEKARELMSILTLIEEKNSHENQEIVVEEIQGESGFYKQSVGLIYGFINELKNLLELSSQKEKISLIPEKIKNQKFSIGVTGVMNAGKSTTLNALLHQDILGTSVVPETANLTVLKYSKTPKAVVNFWAQSEWDKIEQSAKQSESLSLFVKESKEKFSESFTSLITHEGTSIEINLDELVSFTSAKHSNGKCNLVKSVELYSDLKFLEDGVVIVDTPGLDDPVVQREEITKEYLAQCDLMIHLMNVNQSATAKDVEFIVDTLLYQNVSRLLILITRIDTVSQEELQEVINYTQKAIKEKLASLNKERSFEGILKKLHFIPIASKVALQYRTNQEAEAKKSGYSLENCGILEVEGYLEEVLFGKDSQKAKIILASNLKELLLSVETQENLFEKEKLLLSKNSNEIEEELKSFEKELQSIQDLAEKLNLKVKDAKEELETHFLTLSNMVKNRNLQLQSIIKRRVVDDVSYEQRKNKKRPLASRISSMVETGIKDGFIDLVREYRYGFEKKIEEIFDSFARDFQSFEQKSFEQEDAKSFFESYFEANMFVSSTTTLIESTNKAIDELWKKDIESLDIKLEEGFGVFFQNLLESFMKKTSQINAHLLKGFEANIKGRIEAIEKTSSQKEELLKSTLLNLQNSSFDKEQRLKLIETKEARLKELNQKLLILRGKCE